ncbi:MAG TPA: hypothetical protein VEQ67_06935, partial [Mycobacterium sp.]|nr:hypothetical protein [Mycobacterium sp.]
MIRTTQLFAAAALGIVLGASACHNDELFRPANFVPIDPLFERYVSMGNSITAGFQSAGINDSTQLQAYPVLLANAMGSPFFPPLLTRPGCPPPFTNAFTGTRVTPLGYPTSTATSCYLRQARSVPQPYVSNTAVPGAEVLDIYNNLDTASNPNALTTLMLGGLTQTQMEARAHPTFVTVWIGNNDVLGAATNSANGGDSTKITPVTAFQARYTSMLDSVAAVGLRGGVLIGVANVTSIPFFSRGSTYYTADSAGQIPGPFTAAASCQGPAGDSVLVPFPFGAALVGGGGTLTCTEPQTVQPAELRKLVSTVIAYNAFISSTAAARNWAYYDPNPALDSLRLVPTAVRPFPLIGAP